MAFNREQVPPIPDKNLPVVEDYMNLEWRKKKLVKLKKEIDVLRVFRRTSGYMEMLGNTYLGYKNDECVFIEKVINDFDSLLSVIEKDISLPLIIPSNLQHIVLNSVIADVAYTNRIINKLENIPTKENITEEEYIKILETTLSENQKKWLLDFKEVSNYLIYYFDLIKSDKTILTQECSKENGWLESFDEYYTEKEKVSSDAFIRLQNINFFARLKGKHCNAGNRIKEMKEICQPIDTEEKFEEAFEKLKNKGNLDKEAIMYDFLERPEEFKRAA